MEGRILCTLPSDQACLLRNPFNKTCVAKEKTGQATVTCPYRLSAVGLKAVQFFVNSPICGKPVKKL